MGDVSTALVLAQLLEQHPELQPLVQRATPDEQRALVGALRAAWEAGTEQADQRTGRLMARIFGGFVGVTPGCDQPVQPEVPRARLSGFVRLLGGR
jgi:hypothetical protein